MLSRRVECRTARNTTTSCLLFNVDKTACAFATKTHAQGVPDLVCMRHAYLVALRVIHNTIVFPFATFDRVPRTPTRKSVLTFATSSARLPFPYRVTQNNDAFELVPDAVEPSVRAFVDALPFDIDEETRVAVGNILCVVIQDKVVPVAASLGPNIAIWHAYAMSQSNIARMKHRFQHVSLNVVTSATGDTATVPGNRLPFFYKWLLFHAVFSRNVSFGDRENAFVPNVRLNAYAFRMDVLGGDSVYTTHDTDRGTTVVVAGEQTDWPHDVRDDVFGGDDNHIPYTTFVV